MQKSAPMSAHFRGRSEHFGAKFRTTPSPEFGPPGAKSDPVPHNRCWSNILPLSGEFWRAPSPNWPSSVPTAPECCPISADNQPDLATMGSSGEVDVGSNLVEPGQKSIEVSLMLAELGPQLADSGQAWLRLVETVPKLVDLAEFDRI